MRRSVTVTVSVSESGKRDNLVCPKPRRLGLINTSFNEPISPIRWQMSSSNQSDFSDSKAGSELLDIILSRGGYTVEQTCTQTASPSPFFCGSPPSRVSNPLIQDARFGDEVTQISPRTISILDGMPASPSSSARKGACGRANFGNVPVVRIEGGFDCFDRDSRSCSIPTMA
ncbi:Translocase subunit seca [Heracleum sosnowskyi]|uniref:Translocase subunit seca n=1 Tax=Heracleum sosnowskyi TaxID=360622 RepID=A0AAD8MYV9_9APIA|nr:Translocase subunit seca [Heracleum sosnowskyi]